MLCAPVHCLALTFDLTVNFSKLAALSSLSWPFVETFAICGNIAAEKAGTKQHLVAVVGMQLANCAC